jgi:predicted nucleic acid-binding protein
VLQEILHHYVAINRRDAIQPAFDAVQRVVTRSSRLLRRMSNGPRPSSRVTPALSARDALHVATMERNRVTQIMSFDAGFDRYPGLERLER